MKTYLKILVSLLLFSAMSVALGGGALVTTAQQEDNSPLATGAQLYAENCAVCHGENGEGRIGATLAVNWPSIRPELATRATIAAGVPGSAMPAWSQAYGGPLSEADIDDIVAYILSWQVSGEPQTPAPVPTVKSPWSGWGGVVMTVLLFILIVALILSLQKLAKE